jgi:hypothetical protein
VYSSIRALALAGTVAFAATLVPACNASPAGPSRQRDASADTTKVEPDAAPDASKADSEAGAFCTECDNCWARGCVENLDAYCAEGRCPVITNWPADPRAFCGLAGYYTGTAVCGSYHAVQLNEVDAGTNLYYSLSTGKLVAIVGHDYECGKPTTCYGGPADFVEPMCDWVQVDCSDSGGGDGAGGAGPTDSGTAGAGGG